MILAKDLKLGEIVSVQLTGCTGRQLCKVVQVEDCKYGIPYLEAINEDGTPTEGWLKDTKLKDGDYIAMELVEQTT